MKTILFCLLILPVIAFAQRNNASVDIAEGMHYKYQVTLNDGSEPFYTITIDSLGEGCKLRWQSDAGDAGTVTMSEQALASGHNTFWGPLQPNSHQELVMAAFILKLKTRKILY